MVNLKRVYHGVSSKIKIIEKDKIFNNLPGSLSVGRYHSWVVKKPLPESLIATSIDENGEIMSLKHKEFKIRGVQFHPESILTPNGKKILENWLIS